MRRLLNIEWKKIFYYKSARIFTILYFTMLIALGVILAFIEPNIGGVDLNIAELGFFNFPNIWQDIAYVVSIGKIFLAVIIIMNVTNEYSNRTVKQNLIDGLSKKEFLQSKFYTNLIFAILSTLFVFVITLILGFVFSKTQSDVFKGMEFIGAYFLKLVFFFSFCLFLAFLLRKSAFALLGLFVWWIFEGIVGTVEYAIKAAGQSGNVDPNGFFFSNYLPLSSSSNLIGFPTINIEGFITGNSIFVYSSVNWSFVIASVLWTGLFTWFSILLLKKRDL
jgi:ABC-2 type transport system permease protein